MRLQTFLLNEDRSKPISYEEAAKLIKKDYSNSYKIWKNNKYEYIYRGLYSGGDEILHIDPKSFTDRMSANTSNYYTYLINNILPSWKVYPKRNVICSTDEDYASGYGDLYSVLPINGAKIGICPSYDIWESFKKYFDQLSDLNYIFEYQGIGMDIKDITAFIKNGPPEELIELYDNPINHNLESLINRGKYNTIFDMLDKEVLNPKVNRFEIKSAGSKLPDNNEIWFNDKALLILNDPDVINKLTKMVE